MSTYPPNAKYPDTIAVTYDELNHKLTSIYNDHSIYIWDVRDVKRVSLLNNSMYGKLYSNIVF